jgi:hypothetical protein
MKWIPVSERLPQHGDAIWVYDGDVLMGEYWQGSGFHSYGASMDREGLNSETLHGVTHWMDIDEPEPPCTPSEGTRQAGCTLTDAEREAVELVAEAYSDKAADAYAHNEDDQHYSQIAATLRGLLERTRTLDGT